MPDWFGMFFYVAAPPSERDKFVAQGVTSLANANNKGYTVNSFLSQYTGEMQPGDGTLGPYHSGAQDSGAGDCTDFRILGSGTVLMAGSDCEPTWGSLGWEGSRNITEEGYLDWAATIPSNQFAFDPWIVPDEFKDETKFLGAFQGFGFFMDYSSEALFGSATHPAYNDVVPGGVGPATRSGWPLGMLIKYDFFNWPARNLVNVAWFQLTITNNSELVYGVPLDFDSLYMGLQPGWLQFNQGSSLYRDPLNNVVRGATFCQGLVNSSSQGTSGNGCGPGGDPQHPASSWGSAPPEGVGAGFNYGAAAIQVLKSPIGDVRNKLLTDPTSAFFGLGDPETWDDTITFNHGHMCGFHGCSAVIWNAPGSLGATADYEQRQFGVVSSNTADVFGDRTIADINQHVQWDTWRWEEYPDVNQLDYNRWTPGNWDWDGDGNDDELAWDDCTDNSLGQFDPFLGITKNCSVTWSDTLPGGFGNVYANRGAIVGVGPVPMDAGDSYQFIFTINSGTDLAMLENQINETTAHYLRFYLLPEPAPAPNIVSVNIEQGGAQAGPDPVAQPEASIGMIWDNTTADWRDAFIANLVTTLVTAPDNSPAGRLRLLNPVLVDTLTWLVDNNVEFLYVFKSCDGGGGFTDDGDCNDDPATGPGSKFADIGWLPYQTFEPDDDGNFTNGFTDNAVFGGRSWFYSLVAETRGLVLGVQNGDAIVQDPGTGEWLCTQNCRVETVDIPKILPVIPRATDQGSVIDEYIPIANQSGSEGASVTLLLESPDYVPFGRMNVTAASSNVADGDYRLLFDDEVEVVETAVEGVITNTVVRVGPIGSPTETFTVAGQVALSDAPFTDVIVGTTRTRTYTYGTFAPISVLVDFNDTPLVVSDVLSGDQTVPGSYFGLPNYPQFTYLVDNSLGGTFGSQSYTDANDEPIGPLVEPAVLWQPSLSGGIAMEGRYRVNWLDAAFGPSSPYMLDFTNPTGTKSMITTSLQNRTSVATSTDPDIASFVGLPAEALLEVQVPFTIDNITADDTGTPVTVVITDAQKQTQLLVGSGLDTMWVDIGTGEWIPGDGLLLVEGTAPDFTVIANNGIIACSSTLWLRTSCNPVNLQSRGATGYTENGPDQSLFFNYFQTITAATDYSFNLASAATGADVNEGTDNASILASMDSIKFVPNPYVVFSQYATSGGTPRTIFTHMPPRGVLRIYTVSGQFVQLIRWGPNDLNGDGDLWFNLRTREGNDMAAGLYLFVVTARNTDGSDIGQARGKFVLIK
jgi:hypothetical protein